MRDACLEYSKNMILLANESGHNLCINLLENFYRFVRNKFLNHANFKCFEASNILTQISIN